SDAGPRTRIRPRFFFQAEDGIRYKLVTGVQTCALPISITVSPWTVILTDATGTGRTSRCVVAALPSLAAARRTSPGPTAVTHPVWAIVATLGLELLHSMVRPVRTLPWESSGAATRSVRWVGRSTVSPTTEM